MPFLSSDILQQEGLSHIHLYTMYMGRGYKVVLEENQENMDWSSKKINN